MAARTGKQVLQRFREEPPNLWINGERVTDPTTHPSTRNAVNSLAALYDMQHSPELVEKMTVTSPTSGDLVGRSFGIPRSKEDLCRRSEMHKVWADASLGHMGRTPDYMNVNVMAAGTAGEYFAQIQPRFGENIANYFEYVRENDLTLTHALTSPQIDKSNFIKKNQKLLKSEKRIEISNSKLIDDIHSCKFVLYGASSVVVEAIQQGLVPIHFHNKKNNFEYDPLWQLKRKIIINNSNDLIKLFKKRTFFSQKKILGYINFANNFYRPVNYKKLREIF